MSLQFNHFDYGIPREKRKFPNRPNFLKRQQADANRLFSSADPADTSLL